MSGILDDVWIPVALKEYSYSLDDYGTKTVTGSTIYTLSGVLVPVSSDDETVKSGTLNVGDLIGFFYPDDGSIIKTGQIVEYDNREFEVSEEPILYSLQNDKIIRQVNFKRLDKP